ncbi:MAG: alpha/beta hydrolase [Chitinophagales bacterium]
MKNIYSYVVIIALSAMLSCNKDVQPGDQHFFLKHRNSILPVWIRGNQQAETFIVTIHGGPGGFGGLFPRSEAFQQLEKKYGLVYWDQTGTANDQGVAPIEDINNENFAEETDLVIEWIRQHYPGRKIFLLGHSHGGAIGTEYLSTPERQSKITGWIEVDGAHITVQHPVALNFSKAFVLNYANQQIAKSNLSSKERNFWNKAIAFEQQLTEITADNQRTHIAYVRAAKGYYQNETFDLQLDDVLDLLLLSKNDMAAVTPSQIRAINAPAILKPIDYRPRMHNITLPTLYLWGRYDGILPVALLPLGLDALGTATADRHSFIFENSAHNPFDEESGLFFEQVDQFVERYN